MGNGGHLDMGGLAQNGAHLAGKAGHGEAVRAVGGDLAVDHSVGEAQVVAGRHADGGVLGKHHDAVVLRANAQLAGGAVHAAGLHAAQLALLDLEVAGKHRAFHGHDDMLVSRHVGGAADDLQRHGIALVVHIVGPHVHHGDLHMVGVGMRHAGEDVAGDHVVQRGAGMLDGLYLGTRADKLSHQIRDLLGQVHHSGEPLIRNAHGCIAFLGSRSWKGPLELAQEAHVASHEHA